MELYLKILNESDTPFPLIKPSNIIVKLPYALGGDLEKSLANGAVAILDALAGEIKLTLTEFEVQGLKEGMEQDIKAEIFHGEQKSDILFQRALNVTLIDGKKIIGG